MPIPLSPRKKTKRKEAQFKRRLVNQSLTGTVLEAEQMRGFVEDFFFSYRMYLSPRTLVDCLLRRYHAPPPRPIDRKRIQEG